MKKLSIIIPVYNVEHFIGKCVDSILLQDHLEENVEILFVVDGSKDASEDILRSKLDESFHRNVKIFAKANGGLSSARNFGIKHTTGEYIWFVDSDDWLEPDSLSYVLDVIQKYTPEVIAQMQYFQEIGNITNIVKRYQYEGFMDGGVFCGKDHSTAAQFYIVQRKFWDDNNFKFRLGMYHEDGELTPRMLYKAHKIYVITKPLYHILVREGSITHSVNPKRCYDYMIVLDTLTDFYQKEVKHEHKNAFCHLMSDHVLGLLNLALQIDENTRKDVYEYLDKNKNFLYIFYQSGKIKLIMFALIVKILRINPIKLYKIMKR